MSYFIYPRLPVHKAKALADELSTLKIADLVDRTKDLDDPLIWYAPIGGIKVPRTHLQNLQKVIRRTAEQYGYPTTTDTSDQMKFDTECSKVLFEEMQISPSDASDIGVWYYLCCILNPDIVRWRFPGQDGTSVDRFLGGSRGLRRNTFGRMWWRSYILQRDGKSDPYAIMSELLEDDLVQLTERPSLSGGELLPTQIAEVFIRVRSKYPEINRRMLFRESVKRIRRYLALVSFDVIDPELSKDWVEKAFLRTLEALQPSRRVREVGEEIEAYQAQERLETLSNKMIVLQNDVAWENLTALEIGQTAVISDKSTKSRINRFLAEHGFLMEYSEKEKMSCWSNSSMEFCIYHDMTISEPHQRGIKRTL